MESIGKAAKPPLDDARLERPLSRRALLVGAATLGLLPHAAEKAFAQQAPPDTTDWDRLPADTPGLLARTRLKPDVVALMTNATRFSARRRRELASYMPPGVSVSGASESIPSGRFPFAMRGMGRPKPEETQMARRLADLILHDELWTEPHRDFAPRSVPFTPDFVFNFADTFPGITLSVCPNAHVMRLDWTNEASHAARTSMMLFDPVGREMVAFIKAAFPGDPAAQNLVFTPEPRKPSAQAIISRPPQVPAATWAKIRALKPGMTRADLEGLFQTEGGLSNRLGRAYILRQSGDGKGRYIKINAEYAPADFPLIWRDNKGFLRNPEDVPRAARGRETPTDVIVSLSPLYWGYFVAD